MPTYLDRTARDLWGRKKKKPLAVFFCDGDKNNENCSWCKEKKLGRCLSALPWKETLALEPNQTWDQARVPEELYYLPEDPLERENLVESPDHEEALLTMRALLSEHMNKTGDFRKDEL